MRMTLLQRHTDDATSPDLVGYCLTMTEHQRYEVVREFPGFELRRYEPHVLARVSVVGTFERAGSDAFRPLVSYLGGRNERAQKFAMTAPVLQESPAGRGSHDVSFVMPADASYEALPQPSDPSVTLEPHGVEWAAAARFSGRWTEQIFLEHARTLNDNVSAAGLTITGAVRFARFDPPWTPWFLRHNEVVIPVMPPAGG